MNAKSSKCGPMRIWLEIEYPEKDGTRPGASLSDIGNERAAKLSSLLRHLGVKYPEPVFWSESMMMYCATIDSAGSFIQLKDKGHWYNLDAFVDHLESKKGEEEQVAVSTKKSEQATTFEDLIKAAEAAGDAAAQACRPRPIIVGSPKDGVFGNEIDYSKTTYYEEDGLCGFAWINIKPGTSAFARYLKESGRARTDSYYGGVTVWVSGYDQSVERKGAYARAYAKVLSDAGIKASADSRLD